MISCFTLNSQKTSDLKIVFSPQAFYEPDNLRFRNGCWIVYVYANNQNRVTFFLSSKLKKKHLQRHATVAQNVLVRTVHSKQHLLVPQSNNIQPKGNKFSCFHLKTNKFRIKLSSSMVTVIKLFSKSGKIKWISIIQCFKEFFSQSSHKLGISKVQRQFLKRNNYLILLCFLDFLSQQKRENSSCTLHYYTLY